MRVKYCSTKVRNLVAVSKLLAVPLAIALVGTLPAMVDCDDDPAPGVDWTECLKERLILD